MGQGSVYHSGVVYTAVELSGVAERMIGVTWVV